jgi:hypothetical protein
MAVVVRVAIEDYHALVASPKHEILVILLRGVTVAADETAGSLVQALNIVDSPGRP